MELEKKYWLSDKLWICKEKNDGYSLIIYIIMTNYRIEKKMGSETNYGFAEKKMMVIER